MQGRTSVLLADGITHPPHPPPPPHSLQVTLERSLVSFQKIEKVLISPKSFATISPTSPLNLPCCLVS